MLCTFRTKCEMWMSDIIQRRRQFMQENWKWNFYLNRDYTYTPFDGNPREKNRSCSFIKSWVITSWACSTYHETLSRIQLTNINKLCVLTDFWLNQFGLVRRVCRRSRRDKCTGTKLSKKWVYSVQCTQALLSRVDICRTAAHKRSTFEFDNTDLWFLRCYYGPPLLDVVMRQWQRQQHHSIQHIAFQSSIIKWAGIWFSISLTRLLLGSACVHLI